MVKRSLAILLLASSPAFATSPQFGPIRLEVTQNVVHATAAVGTDAGSSLISKNAWNAAHTTPAILVHSIPAGLIWPGPGASLAEFCESTNYRFRANLTNAATARLVATVVTAGGTGSVLRAQYTTDLTGATGWAYLDGSAGPSVAIDATGTAVSSSVTLATAAKADVLLRLVGLNGDGAGGSVCTTAQTTALATALAANGTNCSAGSFPLGVDASGNSETCTALPTTIAGTTNQITASASTGAITLSIPTNPTLPGTTSGTFSGALTGNASTATALAANGANCSAGSSPLGVDASGAAESCTSYVTTAGLGTGVGTFLATPSSANLASAVTDETGTGSAVFANTPTLVTPVLGAATGTSVNLSGGATVGAGVNYCADAGANDTYACSISPAPTAYSTGTVYTFKANTANTGAASINFNSLGAVTIVKTAGGVTTTLADNDIRAGSIVEVAYDGTNMQLLSAAANAASSGITIGTTAITSGTATRILRESSGNVVTEDANLVNDGSTVTVGTGITGTNRALVVDSATSTGNPLTVKDAGTDVSWFADGGALRLPAGSAASPSLFNNTGYTTGLVFNAGSQGGTSLASNSTLIAQFQVNTLQAMFLGSASQIAWNENTTPGATDPTNSIFARKKTLTEAGGAETVLTADFNWGTGSGFSIMYSVFATDATDYALREGELKVSCVAISTGTVTCTKSATAETDDSSLLVSTNSKTLTYAITLDTSSNGRVIVKFNIDSDMTVSTAWISWVVVVNGKSVALS